MFRSFCHLACTNFKIKVTTTQLNFALYILSNFSENTDCNIPPVEARAGKAVPARAATGGITF